MARSVPAFAGGVAFRGVMGRGLSASRARSTCARGGGAVALRRWTACASGGGAGEVTREVVEHTVKLAHLDMSESEIDRLTPEFQKIVSLFDTLSTLDLDGVEPMSRVEDSTNVLRDDVPSAFPDIDGIMSEAPLVERDFIRVPKIGSDEAD